MSTKVVDFGSALPPECPDGGWIATVKVKHERRTSTFGEYQFIDFVLEEALESENSSYASGATRVSKMFSVATEANPRQFRAFKAEIQAWCKATSVEPPQIAEDVVGTLDGWADFLRAIDGQKVTIYTQSRPDKAGKDRVNVSFTAPRAKSGF